jgi:hypothetical protein
MFKWFRVNGENWRKYKQDIKNKEIGLVNKKGETFIVHQDDLTKLGYNVDEIYDKNKQDKKQRSVLK